MAARFKCPNTEVLLRKLCLRSQKPADAESLFSLDYLRELARPIPADAAVEVDLGVEQPVTLAFDVGNGGAATFLLSPRRSVA